MGESKVFHQNDLVLREGDTNQDIYFLISGQLQILKKKSGKDEEVAKMEQGKFFGELSILNQQRVTASVVVISESATICVLGQQVSLTS